MTRATRKKKKDETSDERPAASQGPPSPPVVARVSRVTPDRSNGATGTSAQAGATDRSAFACAVTPVAHLTPASADSLTVARIQRDSEAALPPSMVSGIKPAPPLRKKGLAKLKLTKKSAIQTTASINRDCIIQCAKVGATDGECAVLFKITPIDARINAWPGKILDDAVYQKEEWTQ